MAHRPRGNVTLTGYSTKPDSLSYFLSEMRTIRESKVIEPGDELDFSELEEANVEWLKKAGFENYVSILEDSLGDEEAIDSSIRKDTAVLPQSHARAIHKRMHTLRTTIRSRNGRKRPSNNGVQESWQLFGGKETGHIDSQVKEPSVQLISVEKRSSTTPPINHSPKPRKVSSPSFDNIPMRENKSLPRSQSPLNSVTPPTSNVERQTSLSCDSSPVSSRKFFTPPNSLSFSSPKRKSNGVPERGSSSFSLNSDDSGSPSDMKLSFCFPASQPISENDLPVVSIDHDPLGITETEHLSESDLEKVRCLAHIEVSVTFDENGIPLRTLKSKKPSKVNEEQLFGVPLMTMLQNDLKRNSNASIPLLFEEMIEYLEANGLTEEGLLRVSGSKQRAKTIQDEIEASFNSGTFTFKGKKPSDISSLLKQFIRDLPVPLLTMEILPAFALLADINDFKERLKTLNLLVLTLPTLHQRVLKRLLVFCENIHLNREVTKMDITNISMVLAPNLFLYLPGSKLGCDDITLANKTSHVVMLLIKYHTVLWTIPAGMVRQVRFLYESELKKVTERNIKQALQKMTPTQDPIPSIPQSQETTSYVIRVCTPLFTCHSKAVNIQENPTVGSVIAKVRKRSQLHPSAMNRMSSSSFGDHLSNEDPSNDVGVVSIEEQFLYEVGGNIGERRLDSNANMRSLYAVNPNATWVLKPKCYHERQPHTD